MNEQKILDYNRRCAEFLGCVEHSYPSSMGTPFHGKHVWMSPTSSDGKTRTFYCAVGEEHFHNDWNWIIEVAKAIIKIPNNSSPGDTTLQSRKKNVQYSLMSTNKEAIVEAIDEFLIWYNER